MWKFVAALPMLRCSNGVPLITVIRFCPFKYLWVVFLCLRRICCGLVIFVRSIRCLCMVGSILKSSSWLLNSSVSLNLIFWSVIVRIYTP